MKSKGLRITPQRDQVTEIALQQEDHFEIQFLINETQRIYPKISPATVYRTVSTLCEAGLLSETLQSNTGVTLYEVHHSAEHHDHIVCMDCGKIVEFHDEQMEEAQQAVTRKLSFEQVRHKHVIYARCGLLKRK